MNGPALWCYAMKQIFRIVAFGIAAVGITDPFDSSLTMYRIPSKSGRFTNLFHHSWKVEGRGYGELSIYSSQRYRVL